MEFSDEDILDSLTRLDQAALILLSEHSATPIDGKTAYQKQLFFISKYDELIGDEAAFDSDNFGPMSEVADNKLDNLIALGMVEMSPSSNNTHILSLTERGKKIAELVKKETQVDIEEIADIKEFFNDLTLDEFILFTYVLYPDYTKESKIKDRVLGKRIKLSISLYKKGKVDLEMAAHLSDLSMETFLNKIEAQKGAA